MSETVNNMNYNYRKAIPFKGSCFNCAFSYFAPNDREMLCDDQPIETPVDGYHICDLYDKKQENNHE